MNLPSTRPEQFLPYKTLKQILAAKPPGVFSVAPETSIFSALQLMAEKEIGALVVLDGERLAGIFSERDYARKVVLVGKASKDTPVRVVMTEKVLSVSLADDVPHCMALMTDKRVRHLPVLEGGRLIGLLSIGDLVKEMLSHHERLIRDLAIERMSILNPGAGNY
jgi:CBS domain-containing protein